MCKWRWFEEDEWPFCWVGQWATEFRLAVCLVSYVVKCQRTNVMDRVQNTLYGTLSVRSPSLYIQRVGIYRITSPFKILLSFCFFSRWTVKPNKVYFSDSLTVLSRPDLSNSERKNSMYFNNDMTAGLARPALLSLSQEYLWKKGIYSHKLQVIICNSQIGSLLCFSPEEPLCCGFL